MNCPTCGASNREGAQFCGSCGQPLPAEAEAPEPKTCPRCGQPNRAEAGFCGHCGYTFPAPGQAPLPVPRPAPRQSRGLASAAPRPLLYALAALVAVLFFAGLGAVVARFREAGPAARPAAAVSPSPRPTITRPASTLSPAASQLSPGLSRALLATVQVIVPAGAGKDSAGSGSVLTAKGHILTNLHVVADPDTGKLYNREGTIYIAVNPSDLRNPPEERFIAELFKSDLDLDLAVLKIVKTRDGGALPADLGLTTMPVGDSDTVAIGDALSIIGFPGLGGETVTLTRGSVAGFLASEGWIKTDAEINSGNSGGAALNAAGLLVGVPSAAVVNTSGALGKIGMVRPVNLARTLIQAALQDASQK